jgi:succinyl-CoA synthetase beta subunit
VKSYELNEDLSKQMSDVVQKLYQCFIDTDAILIEINPLGVTIDGNLVLADQKFNIDDNSQFRQQNLFMLEDLTQKNWK